MNLYLVAGAGAPAALTEPAQHLPTQRPRRYPSDTSDVEWDIIAPYIPIGGNTGKGGRPSIYSRRNIVDAVRYHCHTGAQWRATPADLPRWQSVYQYFRNWSKDGTLNRMHNALREQVRVAEGRAPVPTAALVDSQSVPGADTVGQDSRGYDAGKKVNGRKRHIVVDTTGLLLVVLVTVASVQDRDAARTLLWALRQGFPSVVKVWADGGYTGKLVAWVHRAYGISLTIVNKLVDQVGFVVLHRRWVVERTFSWIRKYRRTVRDYERLPRHHAAWVQWSMTIIMSRRLAGYHASRPQPQPSMQAT